jgi:hypothetical protein
VHTCSMGGMQKMDSYSVLKSPLTTESAMKKIEDNNTLVREREEGELGTYPTYPRKSRHLSRHSRVGKAYVNAMQHARAHTHTHTHTCTHTYTHMHMHVHTHTHTDRQIHAHAHTCIYTRVHA